MNNVDPKAIIREVCKEFYDDMEPLNKRMLLASIAQTFDKMISFCGFLVIVYGIEQITEILLSIFQFFKS